MFSKNNLQYTRLFVLNPEYYKKLSEVYEDRMHLNEFGREVSDVLFDKSLFDTQKYYLYLKNLSKRLTQFKSDKQIPEKSKKVSNFNLYVKNRHYFFNYFYLLFYHLLKQLWLVLLQIK